MARWRSLGMSLVARAILSRKRSRSGGPSRTAMAVIVDRSSGSFSIDHIRASASLIRLSKRISSAMAPSWFGVGRSLSADREHRRHERLLRGAAVLLADVAVLTGHERDLLLGVDLGQRHCREGVVGVGDELDVEP